tara:strand:+ start:2362 stop:2559 length:198 start_codon:yes stop_codon:yes gene_type:complete
MEVIWSLLLTVCFNHPSGQCLKQDIQWFDEKSQCFEMKEMHENIPKDGNWKTVKYKCTVVGSKEA